MGEENNSFRELGEKLINPEDYPNISFGPRQTDPTTTPAIPLRYKNPHDVPCKGAMPSYARKKEIMEAVSA
jgi:hypothetical protein